MGTLSLHIEPIGTVPAERMRAAVTADGHVVGLSRTEDRRIAFCWDGHIGEPFDGVPQLRDERPAIFVSGDGCHVAYVGVRGDRLFVGRDAGEDPPIVDFSMSVPPTFDRTGRHLAYGARREAGGAWDLVVDGQFQGVALSPIAVAFSPDGARFAYVEMRGSGGDDFQQRIVLDGVPGEWFRGMRNPAGALQYSPDGSRFAFYSVDGKGHGRWTVDGVAQRWVNDAHPVDLTHLRGVGFLDPPLLATFSPNSRRFAYWADVEKGVAMIEDDAPGPLLKKVGSPIFSPDSRRLAYAAETFQDLFTLVVDGMHEGAWEAVNTGDPAFSPDGRRVALGLEFEEGGLFRKRRAHGVAIDGQLLSRLAGDDASRYIAWSPDSAHVAGWLLRGEVAHVVVDGEVREAWPPVAGELAYDPAGHVVYASAGAGAQSIVVDGRSGPMAEGIVELRAASASFHHGPRPVMPFAVSPEGEHVAWVGGVGNQACPILDDEIGPTFDDVIDCRFGDDGTVTWWARRGTELLRLEAKTAVPVLA